MGDNIIISSIRDIDKIILSYLDLNDILKLIRFTNMRETIVDALPAIISCQQNKHSLDDVLLKSSKYYDTIKIIAKLVIKLSRFDNFEIMGDSYNSIMDFSKSDIFHYYLTIELFHNFFQNRIILFEYFRCFTNFNHELFLKIYNVILRQGNFDMGILDHVSPLKNKAALPTLPNIILIPHNMVMDYLIIVLSPAVENKNKPVTKFIIDFWWNQRDAIYDCELKRDVDTQIVNALGEYFKF